MIRDIQWDILDRANREMAVCLERVRKVRASGDSEEIQRAEMAYLQALQCVYDAAQNAVADRNRDLRICKV